MMTEGNGKTARLEQENGELRAAVDEERCKAEALGRLVEEQAHRGRNLMSIIQAMTLRTLGDGREMGEARGVLMGRLRALARAYDILSVARARGIDLARVVEAGLGTSAERVAANGPPVLLSVSFAQTFALTIHELAANAVRHGALGAPGGTVALGWALIPEMPERPLELSWIERGGPPVPERPPRGFGMALLSSLAREPEIEFAPEGFSCRLRLPVDVVIAEM